MRLLDFTTAEVSSSDVPIERIDIKRGFAVGVFGEKGVSRLVSTEVKKSSL